MTVRVGDRVSWCSQSGHRYYGRVSAIRPSGRLLVALADSRFHFDFSKAPSEVREEDERYAADAVACGQSA